MAPKLPVEVRAQSASATIQSHNLRQEVVYVVEGEIAQLSSEVDEIMQILPSYLCFIQFPLN